MKWLAWNNEDRQLVQQEKIEPDNVQPPAWNEIWEQILSCLALSGQ